MMNMLYSILILDLHLWEGSFTVVWHGSLVECSCGARLECMVLKDVILSLSGWGCLSTCFLLLSSIIIPFRVLRVG